MGGGLRLALFIAMAIHVSGLAIVWNWAPSSARLGGNTMTTVELLRVESTVPSKASPPPPTAEKNIAAATAPQPESEVREIRRTATETKPRPTIPAPAPRARAVAQPPSTTTANSQSDSVPSETTDASRASTTEATSREATHAGAKGGGETNMPLPPVSALTTKLEVVCHERPAPSYPPVARRLGEQGVVVVRVALEPSGRIISAAIAEDKTTTSSRLLREAAIDAVRRWRCEIPTAHRAERVEALQPFRFVLK